MKAIVLCAGYATRLYPLTLNQPKHLLPIAGRPMLHYVFEKIYEVEDVDRIYIITNSKFFNNFQDWVLKSKPKKETKVLDDGTTTNETRLGATGDTKFVIDKEKLNDDILVVAGDNLFLFSLKKFVEFAKSKGLSVAIKHVPDLELMKKYSQVELDKDDKLISFEEKPQNPKTTLAAICIYFFPKNTLYLIDKYLAEGNPPDPPGKFIEWVHKKIDVYGFVFEEKWYDIGDINQYRLADEEYKLFYK